MKPEISFVMPTKNRAQRIGAAVESILQQSVSAWELIVVDDHSDADDETPMILKAFNDPRIRYVRLGRLHPGGIAMARNVGNMFARSPFIAPADSDDYVYPNRAAHTLSAFREYGADVVYGTYNILDEASNTEREAAPTNRPRPFSFNEFRDGDYIPHAASAYRREIAYHFPYNSLYRRALDYEFFVRLAVARKKFQFVDEVFLTQIIHTSNISHEATELKFERILHATLWHGADIDEQARDAALKRTFAADSDAAVPGDL